MSCKSGWYEDTYYGDNTFAVMQPSKLVDCVSKNDSDSEDTSEANQEALLVLLTMMIGLSFLVCIMCRSYDRRRMDWYRLLGFYIVATMAFPIALQVGPQEGGFNRVAAFAVLIHNLGELFIISHIWFGEANNHLGRNRYSGLCSILYVWAVMTLIVFLRADLLFLFLMIQGAAMDWCLVLTLATLGFWLDSLSPARSSHSKGMGCYGRLGLAAALLHILSVQFLFIGFATTMFWLNGFTVIALMPTFILYIFFASADEERAVIILSPTGARTGDIPNTHVYMELEQEEREQEQDQADYSQSKEKGVTYGDIIRIGMVYLEKEKGWSWFKRCAGGSLLISVINSLLGWLVPCYVNLVPSVCD